jgi:AraC family transcriptional regulator
MEILYHSSFCKIINYLCACTDCTLSKPEYQDRFSFCFIRKGNFLFKAFRSDLDSHTGRILINKPGYDYRVAHAHTVPDQCTIFSFEPNFFVELCDVYKDQLNGFTRKRDIQSILIKTNAAIDYVHWQILKSLVSGKFTSLEIDTLLVELVERVFLLNESEKSFQTISDTHKRNYLPRMERAKDFIQHNFSNGIRLSDIASECAMSAFHFARIFRRVTGDTPHQYLSTFRCAHAAFLLKNTSLPISDVSVLAGYNSPSHFSTEFKSRMKSIPKLFR